MTKPVSVPIVGNAGPLRKELRGASDSLGKFGTSAGNTFKKFGQAAGIAFAAAGAGAAIFAKDAIGAASDLQETLSKTNVIFGDAAGAVVEYSETTAKSIGQSQQEALDAASTFAVFGKSAGLAGTDLVNFSTDFVTLASDIASFNNAEPSEVVNALGAALRGEAEPMRRFGVLINDASLKTAALEMGIYDGNGALTSQQKVLAANKLIYQQTGDAQGDFLRTSDGLANQQRILKARLKDVSAEVGSKLLPAVNTAVGYLGDLFDVFDEGGAGGVFGKLKDDLGKGFSIAFEWIKTTGIPLAKEKLAELGKAFWEWIKDVVPPALRALAEMIGKLGNWVVNDGLPLLQRKLKEWGDAFVKWIGPNIAPMLKEMGKLIGKLGEWLATKAVPALVKFAGGMALALIGWTLDLAPQIIKGLAGAFIEIVKKLPGIVVDLLSKMGNLGLDIAASLGKGIVDGLGKLLEGGGDIAKSIVNGLIGFINDKVIGGLNNLLEFTVDPPGPGSFTVNPPDIPEIPKLAKGGIVNRPTLALIGEAGPEAVVPLNGSNTPGGNTYITIEVNGGDPRAVVEALKKYQRTNGYIPITAQKVA